MKLFILSIAVLISGCASMSKTAIETETAWQIAHAVDTGQTVTIARDSSCFYEADPIGRNVLGRNPSEGRVYAVMISGAVAHYAITRALDGADPGKGFWHTASLLWQGTTLGWKIDDVWHNFDNGVHLWSSR